jgi:alanyl-tRNA synthetase
MNTTRLYQNDVYVKEWDARIMDVLTVNRKPYGECWQVILDRSAFFPEGGGQSCDLGKIGSLEVIDVQEDGEKVLHFVKPGEEIPEVGSSVHCTIDWDRRFDNMQRHCGEHILSGIFYRECGGVNRGFHMGDDYMTVDISLEDEPTNPLMKKPEELTYEMAIHCERLANEVIWSNLPVTVMNFDDSTEAEKLPLRKKLALDESISIVCVGSPENAADCVACCGTHPATSGQVGLIKIFKVENYKGMFRIYFEAGSRALEDYNVKHCILTDLSNRYSSSIEDFPDRIRIQEEKLAAAKNELHHIKKAYIENERIKLNGILADGAVPDGLISSDNVVVYHLEDLSMDDAFNMAKEYMGKPDCMGKLIMLYSVPQTSYILVSDGAIKCGQLVKEYAGFYGGKGGGSDVSARAIFTSHKDARLFADLIMKHLKQE